MLEAIVRHYIWALSPKFFLGEYAQIIACVNQNVLVFEKGPETMASATSPSKPTEALLDALARVLAPIVRVLLRYGVTYRAFDEVAKRAYVQVAAKDFSIPDRKASTSRIAVLTGMTRREISTLLKSEPGVDPDERINRAARVVAAWRREPEFRGKSGRPLPLPFEGEGEPTFSTLVRLHGSDVPARATLDELLRVGAVDKTKDGRIRLVARAYVPAASDLDAMAILGSHVPDLVGSIDHNLAAGSEKPYLQRRVVYDNVPVEHADVLRGEVSDKGQALLERLDRTLSKHDRDASKGVEGSGRKRIGLGVYYFEEDVDEKE